TADTAVVVCLHQLLRLERPQGVEHALSGHTHGFGDLGRRLRPLEQVQEPQSYWLQGHARACRVVDDVEVLGAHANERIGGNGQINSSEPCLSSRGKAQWGKRADGLPQCQMPNSPLNRSPGGSSRRVMEDKTVPAEK